MNAFVGIAAAVPSLVLAYALFSVWANPMSWDNGAWVPYGVGILCMEFLILHSSAFIGQVAARQTQFHKKLKFFLGLFVLYICMGLGFALATDSPSLLVMLAVVMLSRFVLALQGEEGVHPRVALGVTAYILMALGTILLPVPEWGITQEIVNQVYPGRGGGLWEREPERAIAGGACYFALMGIMELYWAFKPPRLHPIVAR